MMNQNMESFLFELIASEADECFYIRDAELPVIMISGKYSIVGRMPKNTGDKFTVWFGNGIERWSFKTLAEAETKAWEIIAQMQDPVYGRVTYRHKKETYAFEEIKQ